MTSLFGLWLVSITLSAVALAIMVCLIAARWLSERRGRTRLEERKRLVPLLLDADASSLVVQDPEPADDLLTDTAVELIRLVRGTERERFVASARRLGVAATLRQRLRGLRPRRRISAAEALSEFPPEESAEPLAAALDDRNEDVRLTAALGLAGMQRAPNAAWLVQHLALGTREMSMLVTSLFEQIARDRPDEIRALVEERASPAPIKAAAIEALVASGDYSLVPVVTELALDADPGSEELPRYLRALGAFGHPAAAPAIQKALASDTWWVRAAAAEAAGRIGLFEVAYTLGALLDDTDWWVRFRAGEALVRLGEPGQRLLFEFSRCGGERARQAASLTIAERGLQP